MQVKVTRIFRFLQTTQQRINLLVGGAGSSKSYSIVQYILLEICARQKNKRILIVRKTKNSLRASCWQLIIDLISEYHIKATINHSSMLITIGTNAILFGGLDDVEKLKSIEFCNYIWIEEATEVSPDDFKQLNLRLRRKTDTKNKMFLSCNPISSMHWIKTTLEDRAPNNLAIDHSTYLDARELLDADYIEALEGLKDEDPNYYMIYTKGLWGILKNIIYTNWKSFDIIPEKVEHNEKTYKRTGELTFGIDWGFAAPFAAGQIFWYEKGFFIVQEIAYQTHLTNPDIISILKEKIPPRLRQKETFCGTDEPASIEELYRAGFNSKQAITDVRDGLNFCSTHLIGFTNASPNFIKEAQSYKRKEDKNGNVLEEPVKFQDHGMDCLRYGAYSKYNEIIPDIKIF